MEGKKRPLNGLIQDALSSMDNSRDSQKITNKTINKSEIHEDIVKNMSKAEIDGVERKSKNENKEIIEEEYVKWFSELSNKDVEVAGGKGASLSEMYNNKFPVPPGFVVTAQAFDLFITESGIKEKIQGIIDKIEFEDTENLTSASKKIRKLIEDSEFSKELKDEILESYHILGSEEINGKASDDALNILKNAQEPVFVSVRSSATTEDLATASFAGQQESFLNIKGDFKLIEYVKKCFSSLYTPRAIYYRESKGFKNPLIAVVVQKMVDSEKSGVVFSKDPISPTDDVAIEAVFGLGEGIVSGRINPDHYLVSRELKIKKTKIRNKKIAIVRTGSGESGVVKLNKERAESQVLTNGEVLEIADYAIKLEEYYKKPQDIEFAIENNKVYIVQSRPITTLKDRDEKKSLSGNVLLEGLGSSPGIGVGIVRIIKSMDDLSKIKKGDVLVTEMTNPDMVVSMQKSVAIITDEGGMTAHASIVSREMGIPAVVGTGNATSVLKDGMKVTIDGYNGKIYEGEVAEAEEAEIKPVFPTSKVKIKVIVDLPDFAERAAESGIEEIGLTRIEGMIATMKKHPLKYEKENKLDDYKELLRKGISEILKPFKGMWIRASDIRTDEYGSLEGAPEKEINPMLGLHGIRFSLKYPKILDAELLAIKEVAEKNPNKKIGIMFPQVISIEEVKKVKEHFNKYKLENMEFGVMIETPASVQIIDDICKEVDFISFGTNDLTQFTLAVDRGEDEVQHIYNELHPAIFSQIKKVVDSCKRNNVLTSICGQAGSKKEMAEFLFKAGIDSISVNADAAYEISSLIKELEEKLVDKATSSENSEKNKQSSEGRGEDHGKKKFNKRKWEKWRKWKKKKWKERKERESNLPRIQDDFSKERANIEDYKEDNKELKREEKFLEEGKIRIPAEIEEIDNVDKIEKDIKNIQKEAEAKKQEEIQKNKEIKDNVEVNKEDMGVYNPDSLEEKQKYNYNFD